MKRRIINQHSIALHYCDIATDNCPVKLNMAVYIKRASCVLNAILDECHLPYMIRDSSTHMLGACCLRKRSHCRKSGKNQ